MPQFGAGGQESGGAFPLSRELYNRKGVERFRTEWGPSARGMATETPPPPRPCSQPQSLFLG